MQKTFYIISLLLCSTLLLSDDNIENMLENLKQKSELYHQTKEDNAGLVTIYSREDLDGMQANTLKDILKSMLFFTYQEGLVGTSNIATVNDPVYYMPSARLYIDNHEVSSTYFGSAFYIYGDMNLGFVDHIEIYQGGNGIEFGSEPSLITVRVYTKNPNRENGSQFQMLSDNRGSISGYLYDGKNDDNLEYSVYASGNNVHRKSVEYANHDLSKDVQKSHLLMSIKYNNFNLLASRYDSLQDGFAGYGSKKTPTGKNEIDKYHQFIYADYTISDELSVYASVDDMMTEMDFHEVNGYNSSTNSYLHVLWKENVYKVGLKGSKNIASHNLKYGLDYAQKSLSPKSSNNENLNTLNIQGPTELNIYSIYLQDSYEFANSNVLTATLKVDQYSDDDKIKNSINPILRLGYMHSFEDGYAAKIFLNHTYLYPSFFYTTTYSGKTQVNPDLKPTQYNILTTEFSRKISKYSIKVGFLYFKIKDSIEYDSTIKKYANIDKELSVTTPYLEFKYNFDLFNSLYFNIYKGENSTDTELSSDSGAALRVLNQYDKFNFFNELIYRSKYISSQNVEIGAGFDYSLGVTYDFNKRLSFSLKGENVFNKASKTSITKVGEIDNIDKVFLVGVEYLF